MPTTELTLDERIRAALSPALRMGKEREKDFFGGNLKKKLAVLAGNGLTRLSSGLRRAAGGKSTGSSWSDLLQASLDATKGNKYTVSYLYDLGYASSEILEMALFNATRREDKRNIWRKLWKETTQVPPSPVHKAIVGLDVPILTTNYDDLFERAISSESGKRAVVSCLQAGDRPKFKKYPTGGSPTRLYKLHGGFYDSTIVGFDDWFDHGKPWQRGTGLRPDIPMGPERVVANRRSYEKLTFTRGVSGDPFKSLISLLGGRTVLVLGFGLASEELIVNKLIQEVGGRVIALTTESVLDPLWKFERYARPLTINVPLGLVSSPESRSLALLIAIEMILEKFTSDDVSEPLKKVRSQLETYSDQPKNAAGDALAQSYPRIISIGQASVNRVIGVENAISQERAYGPLPQNYSWTPEEEENHSGKCLTNVEVGGQSLNPTLLWDALRIPSALIAKTYADDLGKRILNHLKDRTEWIDFEWATLNQAAKIPKKSEKLVLGPDLPRTENMTVAAWFNLRTLLDSHRLFGESLKFKTAYGVNCFLLGAPVVYATKVSWEAIKREFEELQNSNKLAESDLPLVVYDTGGRGIRDAERWVASQKGIIIASAYSTLLWFVDFQYEKLGEEPKDDRGRIWQISELLDKVQKDPVPPFLQDTNKLQGVLAYVCTLGELGCIYWLGNREGSPKTWTGPHWCRVNFQDFYGGNEWKKAYYKDTRSALECGDFARAGFVASLLSSMGFLHKPITSDDIHRAVGWANWFGFQKLRHFSIEGYIKFVKEQKLEPDLLKSGGPPKGREVLKNVPMDFSPLLKDEGSKMVLTMEKKDQDDLSAWNNKDDRRAWQEEIDLWRAVRLPNSEKEKR